MSAPAPSSVFSPMKDNLNSPVVGATADPGGVSDDQSDQTIPNSILSAVDPSLVTHPSMTDAAFVPPQNVVPVVEQTEQVEEADQFAQQSAELLSNQLNQQEDQALAAMAASVPTAVQSATDTLNPAHGVSSASAKEVREPTITLERPAIDQVPGIQHVEHEKNPDLPPEVESFLQKVENHHEQLPQEVVIADQLNPIPTTKYLAQPVIILPITPEVEKKAKWQSSNTSVRWLLEFSYKIMKMFSGKVIYRQQS
jgi:hypothetical protein